MKIITIIGARPQFIKAAVVSRAFEAGGVDEEILHTGQHFDANMSAVFFEELGLRQPKHHLNIGGGSHGQNTGRMIEQIEEILLRERPQWVLVYGDTDSTLAGAVAAVKLHIPVAHVEAGLRSFNRRMPEEINRILTDHAADLLLTPTDTATRRLVEVEGIDSSKVHQVGDVMFDAALFYGEKAQRESRILDELDLAENNYVLATVHRAENTDDPARLQAILDGFAASGDTVIWPVHPRARKQLAEFKITPADQIRLIEPVGYLDMVQLQKHARLIATDSGGVQKEAYFHKTPCITLRNETEWTELINLGVNQLVGADRDKITAAIHQTLPFGSQTSATSKEAQPYGNGQASQAILERLLAVA